MGKRIWSALLAAALVLGGTVPCGTVRAEAAVSDYLTEFIPQIREETVLTEQIAFTHPGIGMTKDMLDHMRDNVRQGNEPWTTGFRVFASHSKSGTAPVIRYNTLSDNFVHIPSSSSDWTGGNVIIRNMWQDADTAYAQTIMWYITGNQVYRDNAMKILRGWSKVESIANNWDEQIRVSLAVYKFCFAAEILRYADCEKEEANWTEADTEAFLHYLDIMKSKYDRYTHFMNQHVTCVAAYMSAAIFRNNGEEYKKAIDRMTVNSELCDDLNCRDKMCGHNRDGSIYHMIRAVDENALTGEKLDPPNIQLVEMGRDQAHSNVDIAGLSTLAMIAYCQNTRVDPDTGQVSTVRKAVNLFQFLDDRILAGANYLFRCNLGYDVEYVPCYQGNGAIYESLHFNDNEKGGRIDNVVALLYNYYKYFEKRSDMETSEETKYLAQAYQKIYPEGEYAEYFGDGVLLYTYDPDPQEEEGQTWELTAEQDTFVKTDSPEQNFNQSPTLTTGKTRHTYLEFDLRYVSPSSTRILLSLSKTDKNNNVIQIRVAEGTWDEDRITAADNPLKGGNRVSSIRLDKETSTADITNLVVNAVKRGKSRITFELYNEGVKYANEVWSTEGTDDRTKMPRLIITGPTPLLYDSELKQDTYGNAGSDAGHGTEIRLMAGGGSTSYLQFDTARLKEQLADGYRIRRASLTVQGIAGGNSRTGITYVPGDGWEERSLTGKNAPAVSRDDPTVFFSPEDAEKGTVYDDLDITKLLRANGAKDQFSIALWSDGEQAAFCSGDSTVSAPVLRYELEKTEITAMLYDMNGDGKVTSVDALLALRIAVQGEEPTEEQLASGDIDKDGAITVKDATAILTRAAGKQ